MIVVEITAVSEAWVRVARDRVRRTAVFVNRGRVPRKNVIVFVLRAPTGELPRFENSRNVEMRYGFSTRTLPCMKVLRIRAVLRPTFAALRNFLGDY